MKIYPLITLCFLGLTPGLHAQQPAAQPTPRPTPPAGPLLAKAPDFAQWTVTTKTAASVETNPSPEGSPSPSRGSGGGQKEGPNVTDRVVTVVKTKPLRLEQTVMGDGNKILKWCFPDMQFTVRGTGTPTIAIPGSKGYNANLNADFDGFEWISAKTFVGVQKVAGQDCLVFRDALKSEATADGAGSAPQNVACINLESRLPAALQLGEVIHTYQFGPAPSGMLTVPPDVQAAADQWRKTIRQSALMPGKP